jgi:hypothetical protein
MIGPNAGNLKGGRRTGSQDNPYFAGTKRIESEFTQ